jgi:hypothetical protein
VIPKIIVINKNEKNEDVIAQFAASHKVAPSHQIVVQPEKEGLTVEQIHIFQKDIQIRFSHPVLAAFIGVDDSSIEVQNSLLKSLEEDSERILFLFLVTHPARLLPTILSRCGIVDSIYPKPLVQEEVDFTHLFSLQSNSEATKEEAVERIDRYIQQASQKNLHSIHHILTIRKLIIDNNMNPILALDNILIFLSKSSTMKKTHEK